MLGGGAAAYGTARAARPGGPARAREAAADEPGGLHILLPLSGPISLPGRNPSKAAIIAAIHIFRARITIVACAIGKALSSFLSTSSTISQSTPK